MVNKPTLKITTIIIFLISSIVFLWMGQIISITEPTSFDIFVGNIIASIDQPGVLTAMGFITETGSVWWFTMATLIVMGILFLLKHSQWTILTFFLAISGGGLLNTYLKHLFERERPENLPQYDGVGYSFPSGHAMGSMVFYGFIIYLLVKSSTDYRLRFILCSLLIILIFLIGLSRVYLGVHYMTDVLAGYVVGLLWLTLCIAILENKHRMKL